MSEAAKILSRPAARRVVTAMRRRGKTVVAYSGSFDLLHAGHVAAIAEARAQGDFLIILLNSDASIRRYKGPDRPIIPQHDRAALLAALAAVDAVVLFDEINPKRVLDELRPSVYCNGSDWGRDCIERPVVERYGGRIHVLRWAKGRSSTNILGRIGQLAQKPTVRAVFLDRDGTINENKEGYTHRREEFTFVSGAVPALKRLSHSDYKIIVVTNQSGIGRGYFSERTVKTLHTWLTRTLKSKGVRIDAIYYCPHAPNAGCACRKPNTGMLDRAVREFGINLSKSWVVGDDEKDVGLGREANTKTIKIGAPLPAQSPVQPDLTLPSVGAAVRHILAQGKAGLSV